MQQGTLRRFVMQQFDNEHGQKCITSTDRILDSRRYRRLVVPQPTPVQEGSLWTARDAKSVDVIALHERLPQLLPLRATTQPDGDCAAFILVELCQGGARETPHDYLRVDIRGPQIYINHSKAARCNQLSDRLARRLSTLRQRAIDHGVRPSGAGHCRGGGLDRVPSCWLWKCIAGRSTGIQRSVRYTGGVARIRLHQGGIYVGLRCGAHRAVTALIVANSADQHRVRAKTRYMGCRVEWSATYEFAARQQIPQSLSNTDHCRLFHAK